MLLPLCNYSLEYYSRVLFSLQNTFKEHKGEKKKFMQEKKANWINPKITTDIKLCKTELGQFSFYFTSVLLI